MPITRLIKEFGQSFDLITRLRSEAYLLNTRIIEQDPIATLNDYKKVKATFKELKSVMLDLDRAINRVSSEIPTSPPDYGTDQNS